MVKKVIIDESKNEIKYYDKKSIPNDYLNYIFKHMCSSSETIESPPESQEEKEYMLLKNGKKIYK
jgi:hypothetical protein